MPVRRHPGSRSCGRRRACLWPSPPPPDSGNDPPYGIGAAVPVEVKMTSTRLFLARPSSVWLLARGAR